jgi:hypothetical protein
MKDAETTVNGELFIHKILWECCERHSQATEKANAEKAGPIYHELSFRPEILLREPEQFVTKGGENDKNIRK